MVLTQAIRLIQNSIQLNHLVETSKYNEKIHEIWLQLGKDVAKIKKLLRERSYKDNDTLTCPLCNGEMKYELEKETHTWVCAECPSVLFGYYSDENIKDLLK